MIVTQGSKEYLLVTVTDATGTLTDLGSVTARQFDVLDSVGGSKMSNVAASYSGMTAYCLVDTTSGGTWATGEYRLYLEFTSGSEVVRLGPMYFRVVV